MIVMKFGGYQKPASIHNRAASYFGELLKERLGSALDFQLIGSILDELGRSSGDLPEMVAKGELSFCYMSTVRFTTAVTELRILELPFLVEDRVTAYRAFDGAYGELVKSRMRENSPFRLLGIWDNGFRHLSNCVRPISKPQDCRGLRIRTQTSELHGEAFRALGFEPLAIDIKEFTETIASGRVQAQDNPLTNIYNFGVHKHHRHITLTGHFYGASAMICDEARYRNWPREIRTVVDGAALEATAFQRRLAAAEDAAILAKFVPGELDIVRLTETGRAAFVAAVRPVLDRHRKDFDPALLALLETQ